MRNLMKLTICSLALASSSAMATYPVIDTKAVIESIPPVEHESESGSKLLRFNEETVFGVTINLPVTLELNNDVCVRYISDSGVERNLSDKYEKIEVTVHSLCGEAVEVEGKLYPKGLVSMEWFENNDGGVHALHTVEEYNAAAKSSISDTTSDAVNQADK